MRPCRTLFGLGVLLASTSAFAQVVTPEDPAGPNRFSPLTLANEFFDNNYFNYSLFANGVYDSFTPVLGSQQGNTGAFGYSFGGALNAFHKYRRGSFSLSYYGSYQDYGAGIFSSGTNQNLNFNFTRQFGRRWILNFGQGAGILFYGNGYTGSQPNSATYVQANPFASETRFLSSSIGLTYQLTRRLSFNVGGGFFLQRYNNDFGIGTTGGSGSGGVSYRITGRTSVSGGYSHSYFKYQRAAGDANIDNISGSVFHSFPSHWNVTLSGGISHSNVTGVVTIPLSLLIGQQGVGGFVLGRYNTSSNLPSFFGSVSRNLRKSSFYAGAGQSVVSGNGYYLASRNQYVNGGYSHSLYRSTVSAGMNYYRLKSVANSVETTYNGISFYGNYSRVVARHISANLRYDFLRYGNLQPLESVSDSRISFGVAFTSQSIPLTAY